MPSAGLDVGDDDVHHAAIKLLGELFKFGVQEGVDVEVESSLVWVSCAWHVPILMVSTHHVKHEFDFFSFFLLPERAKTEIGRSS